MEYLNAFGEEVAMSPLLKSEKRKLQLPSFIYEAPVKK